MPADGTEFVRRVGEILERYGRQNGLGALSPRQAGEIGARLWLLVSVRGLPRPLATGEVGAPGEMTAAEVSPLVECVLEGVPDGRRWTEPVRQLVKACFHAEFTVCRESYREKGPDGVCRRQQPGKARTRVSGAHCVDCPYWTALAPQRHGELLAEAWCGDPVELAAHRAVFLPEDFRALRQWLHAAARQPV